MGLNRQEMETVINEGGSVLYRGQLLTRHEHLPSAAQLAQTPEEKKEAEADLRRRLAATQAELDALKAGPQPQQQTANDSVEKNKK